MALPMAMASPVILNHHHHSGVGGGGGGVGGVGGVAKDSSWLTLDVCREFTRNKCTRSEQECRFAHPSPNVEVQNGKVICCFDSIKGKCQRHDPPCKYLHPPQHLKEQLLQNGRKNLILRHIQTQFIVNGMQRVLPVHQFAGQNGGRFGAYYSPTYTSFPSLVLSAAPAPSSGDTYSNEDVAVNDVPVGVEGVGGGGGESTAPISTSQTQQHQLWSSSAGTTASSMVAVDSNGYITSYCSPVISPMYFQRGCAAIPGVVPMVKADVATDAKYDLPLYQQPPPCLTYPQMMYSSSIPYQTTPSYFMIPGPVASAVPRY